MGWILNILRNKRFVSLIGLMFFLWLETANSILAKTFGVILLVYSLAFFISGELFVAKVQSPTSRVIFGRFGGFIFAGLSIIFFLNLHTRTTTIEGIFLLIFLVPIFILAMGDSLYKPDVDKIKGKLIVGVTLLSLIALSLSFIIWPEPSRVDFYDFLFLLGLAYGIISPNKKDGQNSV